MKKIIAVSVAVLVLGAVAVGVADEPTSKATEAAEADVLVVLKGTVVVVKEGEILKSIQIQKDDGTFVVILKDAEGLNLQKWAGELVETTGKMKDTGFAVKSSMRIQAKKAK